MERQDAKKWIIEFIINELKGELPEKVLGSEESLLSPGTGIEPRDLLVLVMELQDRYQIVFDGDIYQRRLDYIDELVRLIP